MSRLRSRQLFRPLLVLAVLAGLTGCASGPGTHLTMTPLDQLPAELQAFPLSVQQAFQFSTANPEILQQLPCYCGCGSIGHTSNYSCYVSGRDADGKPILDNHALGCSICVDITQDAIRLLEQGRTVPEIRSYVDGAYARYGPSNMP